MDHIKLLEQHIEELDRTIADAMNRHRMHIVHELSPILVNAVETYHRLTGGNPANQPVTGGAAQ